MKIISNTGPIIGLAKINRLSILKDIAGEIIISPLVHRELLAKTVEIVISELDAGEGSAIGLASTFSEDALLLLDDRAGRTAAEKLNIPTVGLIGILLWAKEKKIILSVNEIITELRENGYWLSDHIAETARRLANE